MSKKIQSKKITFKNGDNTVNVFVNSFESDKNPRLRGFANVSILSSENKMIQQFNSLSIVEAKEGNLFLSEPKQKSFKNKDGELVSNPYYIMKRAIKDDLAKKIEDEVVITSA